MKTLRTMITASLLFMSCITFGQPLSELDKKNGLMHFKFGSSPASFKKMIEKDSYSSNNDIGDVYKVVDKSYSKILGYNTEVLSLIFRGNKLYAISADFLCESDNKNFNMIKYNFINLFGNPIDGEMSEEVQQYGKRITGNRWKAKHTELDLMDLYRNNGSCYYVSMWYYSKDIQKSTLRSEF